MTAQEAAVKAAAEANDVHFLRYLRADGRGCDCGFVGTDAEVRLHIAETAVAAAAPILLAVERARIDRILWDLANEATSVLTAATLMAARRRIAETAPEEPTDVS